MLCTKARSVMEFDSESDSMGLVFFTQPETRQQVTIWTEKWEDLGRPLQITITIEPGDRLNDDPSGVSGQVVEGSLHLPDTTTG